MPSKLSQTNTAWYYDIESFRNIFTVYFKNVVTSEKKCFIICDIGKYNYKMLTELLMFIHSDSVTHLIGYNSATFDDKVLSYLFQYRRTLNEMSIKDLTYCLWEVVQYIIKGDKRLTIQRWNAFQGIDIFKTFGYNRSMVSLKRCAVALNFPKIQDLPLHYADSVTEDMVLPLISYNANDVEVTEAVSKNKDDEFVLREFLNDKFNDNFYNADRTYIGKIIFMSKWNSLVSDPNYHLSFANIKKFQTERSKILLSDVIFPYITFETPEFQEIFNRIKNTVVENKLDPKSGTRKFRVWDEVKQKWNLFSVDFKIDGLKYKIGAGGIHSVNKKEIYEASETHILGELDAATYYPRLIVVGKIFPEHLRKYWDKFIQSIDETINERLFWKFHPEKKDPSKKSFIKLNDDILKIAINALFGLLKSEHFLLKDAKATLAVTVNGELLLLKLIEMLKLADKDINIISANTDGIVYYCHKDKYPIIERVVAKWQEMTGVTMEISPYKKMIFSSVNSYIWESLNGELKQKGEFLPVEKRDFERDMSEAVVVDSVNSYLINNEDIATNIKNCKNIFKFLISKRMGIETKSKKQFTMYSVDREGNRLEEYQKTSRFYVSNSGNLLKKIGDFREEFMIVNQKCIVYNNHVDKPIEEYNINYDYYIAEANKIALGYQNKTIS